MFCVYDISDTVSMPFIRQRLIIFYIVEYVNVIHCSSGIIFVLEKQIILEPSHLLTGQNLQQARHQ